MIPRTIHYIWFGSKPYPEKVQYCIESWKRHLPDYEFKLWNEESFDVKAFRFTREAYEAKKYAFVSDFVRVYALATEGGIYLDTDIEILRDLAPVLSDQAVLGTDDSGNLTALMASEKGHPFFEEILDIYKTRSFIKEDGTPDTEVNNLLLERELARYGYIRANQRQHLCEGIEVYPDDFFHVKSLLSGKIHKTENSYAIHWHTLLWIPLSTRIIRFMRLYVLIPIMGERLYNKMIKAIGRRN